MDDEVERLINTLLNDDIRCFDCYTEFGIQASDLEQQSEELYTTRYTCPGNNCSIEYDIEIEDRDFLLSFKANERGTDRPDDLPDITKNSRKEPLQKESHPVRKIIDAAHELSNAIAILYHNQQQLQDAQEIIENEGPHHDDNFHRRLRADIHNYTAAAYSFEEILKHNVEPHLPIDGPIEDAKTEFEAEHEVIKALRTTLNTTSLSPPQSPTSLAPPPKTARSPSRCRWVTWTTFAPATLKPRLNPCRGIISVS